MAERIEVVQRVFDELSAVSDCLRDGSAGNSGVIPAEDIAGYG